MIGVPLSFKNEKDTVTSIGRNRQIGERSSLFKFQGIQNINVDWDLLLMLTYR
jgi:hypothetical protein